MDIQSLIFEFIGGLGIFLLGIKFMGEGLQRSVGDGIREILDRYTTNPILGVLAGIVVTNLIQSSSATTVLTIGLVNAGFLTLRQAIGVIMGANIGTTTTAFIIGIDIGEYALPIIAIGSFLFFFFKSQKISVIGQAIFGFGALLFGLELMGTGMSPLRSLDSFYEIALWIGDTAVLGVFVGTVFTALIQSSTATVGILQGLYAEGAIPIQAALPILFGANIGTTLTAVLAAFGASLAAKRAALVHVIFNIIGTIVFMLFLGAFIEVLEYATSLFNLNDLMTIAFAHGIFNVINTLILLPFIAGFVWLVKKMISGEDQIYDYQPKHLDGILIQKSSSLALEQAKAEVIRMGKLAYKGLDEVSQYVRTTQVVHADKALQIEAGIDNLDRKVTDYLVEMSSLSMSKLERERHSFLMDIVRDIERIGDHFENIIELVDFQISRKLSLSDEAIEELIHMFDLTLLTVKEAIDSIENFDKKRALEVIQKEEQIDELERKFRKTHIIRVNEGVCNVSAGIIFVDILSNLERIGDHASNIAEEILEK